MHLSSRLLKKSSLCLALLPACFLGILISLYSVDVPYWDQWKITAPLFEKVYNGSLSFSDLLRQENESRVFFPKLVFISLGYLTQWNVRYEMLVTFLLACLVSLNIYCLSNLTISGSTIKKLFIATISNLLIFSPIQWENWLWGIQIIVFVPIVCITSCILVFYSRLATTAKFLISVGLATISTFSYANGILCWIVVFPVLVLNSRNGWTKNRWLILGWIGGFILNVVTYFYNYKKPPYHPSFSEALTHPQEALHYFLSFLGAPLGFGTPINTLTATPIIGLALILLYLASCFYLLKFSSDSALLYRMVGWLMIGMYAVISGVITTFGRVGFGVEQSLASRYTTFSVYLAISLVYIVVIIADNLKTKDYYPNSKKLISKSIFLMAAIILILHLLTSIYAVQQMSSTRIARSQGKLCLSFINFVEEECLTKYVYPELFYLKNTANALDNLGYIKPSLVKSSKIQNINRAKLSSGNYGLFDKLTQVSAYEYAASGSVVFPQRGEAADSIIMTYEIVKGEPNIFTVVDIRKASSEVAKAAKINSYFKSAWQTNFSSIGLPKGSIKIDAWAFDSKTGRKTKLNGFHVIQADLQAKTSIFEANNIGKIKFKPASKNFTGFFDGINGSSTRRIEVSKGTLLTVGGWAILANETRPADSIIITYGENNSLCAVAPVNLKRPDVMKVLKNPAYENSGWSAILNSSTLPTGSVVLKAWIYNSTLKEATLLEPVHEVVVVD